MEEFKFEVCGDEGTWRLFHELQDHYGSTPIDTNEIIKLGLKAKLKEMEALKGHA